MNEILRSTPATLQLEVYQSGTLTNLDANPTVVLTDGHGTAVSTGAVTKPGSTTGIYRSILPGQADLKVIAAAWTGVLAGQPLTLYQNYEIVGNLLFTEAEARAVKIVGDQIALDPAKYSDELIAGWRSTIGDLFEQRLRRGVIQRYCRVETAGTGSHLLDLSYGRPQTAAGTTVTRPGRTWDIARIITATVGGVAQTVGDLTVNGYKLAHTTGTWTAASRSDPLNVVVEYEYGPDPVDPETRQRALDLLVANAAAKPFPSTATALSTEDGTFRITTFPPAVEDMLKQRRARAGFGFA